MSLVCAVGCSSAAFPTCSLMDAVNTSSLVCGLKDKPFYNIGKRVLLPIIELVTGSAVPEKAPAAPKRNLSDLNWIYNAEYNYSLPRSILESFLSGKAFDNKQAYTTLEASYLAADMDDIFEDSTATITAGAPGAGKTTLVRSDLATQGRSAAYIDPDDVALRQMERTYVRQIAEGDGSFESAKAAYDKWRPASNAVAHIILGHLIRDNYALYFGVTSSSPQTGLFFKFLKDRGYKIRLIHVTAPNDVRWKSIKKRDQDFVQTTEKDVREKGDLVPLRIEDTYLRYADKIDFYYRDSVRGSPTLAATWTKSGAALTTLEVRVAASYEKIKAIHNAVISGLGREDIRWEVQLEPRVSMEGDESF